VRRNALVLKYFTIHEYNTGLKELIKNAVRTDWNWSNLSNWNLCLKKMKFYLHDW